MLSTVVDFSEKPPSGGASEYRKASIEWPFVFASGDEPALRGRAWLEQQWDRARLAAKNTEKRRAVLALDEVQKIEGWSETIKRLWDEDSAARLPLHVILLGSASLLVQQGLAESLAGRFEMIRLPHWSFSEMKAAFGWTLDQFVLFGGYPGAAPLIEDPERWARYIKDSIIETTIARDILLLARVDKPALLRRLFELACSYSGQVLSYQKMAGTLQDAGNTTTLAHYLDLLAGSGMVMGLQKYAGDKARRRGSSPKLQVLNTALMTAQSGFLPAESRSDPTAWGRLVESAVGAHLANAAAANGLELHYWRDRNREVDFIVRKGSRLIAVEVKSGRPRNMFPGIEAFSCAFRPQRKLLVGGDGIPLEDFLLEPAEYWVLA